MWDFFFLELMQLLILTSFRLLLIEFIVLKKEEKKLNLSAL